MTLARLGQAMFGLGSVLLLVQSGRSFGVAGLVAGSISVAQGVSGPQVSRLVDRLRQRTVVGPQIAMHVVAAAALVTACVSGASTWLLVGLAGFVGASLPQTGALSRARWTALLEDSVMLERALAIESLIEEAVFVVGPVLVTALAMGVTPAAGLVGAAALTVAGTVMLLAQRGTEPAHQRADPPLPVAGGGEDGRGRHRSALRRPGVMVLIAAFAAIGTMFGLVEVGIVALAHEQDQAGAAGAMLACWAGGSLLAGVAYGATAWRAAPARRFQAAAFAMALAAIVIAAAGASHSLLLTTAALFAAGFTNAPTLITGNSLVPTTVPVDNLTEAYTWLGVSVFAGIAVGTAFGGVLVDRAGASAALTAAIVAALAVAGAALRGHRYLHAQSPGP
ncbi:MAG: MFS transporter [Jatrophihabitans sp.]|uniref:MFS transporter n=1 Tax=Jatrophihabitans sp. TaxID=1932789 RepID=UPI003F80D11B